MRGQQKGVVGTEQGALYELPGGWVWTKLEEVAGKIVDGSHNPPPKQDSTPQFTIQRSVALIKPKITPEYLSWIFQSPFQSSYLLNNAKGTAQKGVYLNQLKGIPIQIAPLPEQRAIVAKIEQLFSDLDNGIANLKKAQK